MDEHSEPPNLFASGYQEFVVRSPHELYPFFTGIDGQAFYFRGQREATWPICSQLELFVSFESGHNEGQRELRGTEEERLLWEFKRRAPNYISELGTLPHQGDDLEWLSLMRHFGVRTRFVDFTESVYVAAFFAVGDGYPEKSDHAAIWAVNVFAVNISLIDLCVKLGVEPIDSEFRSAPTYRNKAILHSLARDTVVRCLKSGTNVSGLIKIESNRLSRRMQAQQGLFLMPTCIGSSFMANLSSGLSLPTDLTCLEAASLKNVSSRDLYSRVNLAKILIHRKDFNHFRAVLTQMNIRHETLFPDLAGLVNTLNRSGYPRHFTSCPDDAT